MVMTNVELYEALKGSVGEDAARLIAEVVPTASEIATKQDLFATKTELRDEISAVRLEIAGLRGEIQKSSKETMRWMLPFFVPLWLGTWGTLLAVLLKR